MPDRFCDSERLPELPAWEPEPLQLPVEAPVPEPRRREESNVERDGCVIIIDLA
jgi:hypothetical protein